MTKECLDQIGKDKGWNTKWLNEQLYGILAEATGLGSRAKGTVMAVEVEKDVNGAKVYRAFAIEHLDGSQQATVALGRKITKPSVAPMDEFEDRLRLYDQDRERYERLTKQVVGELAFVHLQDMIPQEARARFELEKHNFSKVTHLRDFFRKVIADFKASGGVKKKPRALNELAASERYDQDQEPEVPEEGNLLFSLLCHASDEDAAKILGPKELLSFQKWRSAGGKGYNRFQRPGGQKGGFGSTGVNSTKAASTSPGATSLVGGLEVLVPMAGLIDKDAELGRLNKELGRLLGEIKRLGGKLSNEKFVSKAPAQVIDKERDKLRGAETAANKLQQKVAKIEAI